MSVATTDRGTVVVTGTSTGIGAAIVLRLADAGFTVFAGVRRDVDGTALQSRAAKGRRHADSPRHHGREDDRVGAADRDRRSRCNGGSRAS